MTHTLGVRRRRLASILFATLACAPAEPASAQSPGDSHDVEARAIFQAGTTAFNAARYADALSDFRRAYELSHRPEMLYNIGLAADRLRHDDEALRAFEQFLAEVPQTPRRDEVVARVAAIREAMASRSEARPAAGAGDGEPSPAAAEPAASAAGPAPSSENGPAPRADEGEQERSSAWIAGPIALGAVGVAGLTVAILGIAGGGACVDTDASGACVEERSTQWAPVAVYGGAGIAAIAAAVIWLAVGLGSDRDAAGASRSQARSEMLRWSF